MGELSLFSWCAVNSPGENHNFHTHIGELVVGVFYARTSDVSGKLTFSDPRGHSPPFGKTFDYTPQTGDLIFFPAWLAHTATVTGSQSSRAPGTPESKDRNKHRVVFSFNIALGHTGSLVDVSTDPTSNVGFTGKASVANLEL